MSPVKVCVDGWRTRQAGQGERAVESKASAGPVSVSSPLLLLLLVVLVAGNLHHHCSSLQAPTTRVFAAGVHTRHPSVALPLPILPAAPLHTFQTHSQQHHPPTNAQCHLPPALLRLLRPAALLPPRRQHPVAAATAAPEPSLHWQQKQNKPFLPFLCMLCCLPRQPGHQHQHQHQRQQRAPVPAHRQRSQQPQQPLHQALRQAQGQCSVPAEAAAAAGGRVNPTDRTRR
jgi:hypothetical protein